MISHVEYLKAIRARLTTLEVVTTGSITLAGTSTGYTRSTGSFLTDGFAVGMEVAGSGFVSDANNTPKTITGVTALALTCSGCAAEGAAAGRTLSVGLPAIVGWENVNVTPVTGRPYVTEQYLPGPLVQETLGSSAELEARPSYVVGVHGVPNTGLGAAAQYADAILALFPPQLALTASNGDVLRVRGDAGPYRGQQTPRESGWAYIPVTIPFRVRSTNSV